MHIEQTWNHQAIRIEIDFLSNENVIWLNIEQLSLNGVDWDGNKRFINCLFDWLNDSNQTIGFSILRDY